jgi:hypothetical protein
VVSAVTRSAGIRKVTRLDGGWDVLCTNYGLRQRGLGVTRLSTTILGGLTEQLDDAPVNLIFDEE